MSCPTLTRRLLEQSSIVPNTLTNRKIEFNKSAKVYIAIQVKYEQINFLVNKKSFEQYLSAAPTRMFRRDRT